MLFEVSYWRLLVVGSESYQRSQSPVYSEGVDDQSSSDAASNQSKSTVEYEEPGSPKYSFGEKDKDSDGSASTVELEVTHTPPAHHMRLRSAGKVKDDGLSDLGEKSTTPKSSEINDSDKGQQPDTQQSEGADEEAKPSTPKKRCTRQQDASKNRKKKQQKSKPKVAFTLPHQCTVRRDGIDEQCRALKITYRRWPGTTEPKNKLHKSQVDFTNNNDYVPEAQPCPGDCILCPSKKYLQHHWDLRRHYMSTHQQGLLVMDDVVMLQCKCSDVRSRGWDRDHSTRNTHYHCSICHWPRDKASQIKNHLRTIHGKDKHAVEHLRARTKAKRSKSWLFLWHFYIMRYMLPFLSIYIVILF